jgi:creatinine amidohydrolase
VTGPQVQRWRFDALTRDELVAAAPDYTVVVPLGSTEQHGHHLPVRTDAAIVTAVAERAVAEASRSCPILLAPTLPFGFAHHHLEFGGTVSIGGAAYVEVLCEIGRSLSRSGFRRLVFLNGHGGNQAAMALVADRLAYELAVPLSVATTSYWSVAGTALADIGVPGELVPGHAGHFETAMMLALDPELVRLESRPAPEPESQPLGRPDLPMATVRRPGLWAGSDGRTDDARLGSAEIGRSALAITVDAVAQFLVDFHRSVAV